MSERSRLPVALVHSAARWNWQHAAQYVADIPPAARVVYPELGRLAEAQERNTLFDQVSDALDLLAFTLETFDVQEAAEMRAGALDLKFGPRTRDYLVARFKERPPAPPEVVAQGGGQWVYDGKRKGSVAGSPAYRRVTYLDDEFWALSKSSSPRDRSPRVVTGHWGGRNPRSLQDYFDSTDRDVSSHGSVGYDHDGEIILTQTIDLRRVSWHGGWINSYGPGFDFAFSPELDRLDYGLARGWPMDVIDNPTRRGDRKIIDLPDELAVAGAWLMVEWAQLTGAPLQWISRDPGELLSQSDVQSSSGGFIFHSQFDGGKWDFAPWGRKVMEATDEVIRFVLRSMGR